MTRWIGVS